MKSLNLNEKNSHLLSSLIFNSNSVQMTIREKIGTVAALEELDTMKLYLINITILL